MSNANLSRRALRTGAAHAALLTAGLLATVWSTPVFAQPASEPGAVEEIIVTGSRIARRDADVVGALTTLTAEDIKSSAANSVGELMQRLPSAGVSLNTNGTQGTSYGASSINLRYLGGAEGSGNRVLVLVDGRRWVDGVGQRGFRDFVDLNTIPLGMIEGIEVLKDGASAIYGSDAIAGVVNIKTVRDFDGVRATAKYGVTSEGDGKSYSGVLNFGKRWESSALLLSGSYVKDEPILTSARALTANTLVPQTAVGTSPSGLFILPGLASNTYFGAPASFGASTGPITTTGSAIGAGALADDAFRRAALPGDAYNTQAQGIYSSGPSERYGVYARFSTDLGANVRFTGEALYNRRKSDQMFSPVLLDIGGTAGTIRGFAIPANQAFNPFGTANGVPTANALGFAANSAWRIRRVMSEVGNRDNVQDVETVRVSAGFDGEFNAFSRNWSWDLYGIFSKNHIRTEALNGVNYDNLALGLGDPARCAAASRCVPINLFGPITGAMADYIRSTARESNETEIRDITFNITGELFDLPAGPLAVAAGFEHRRNSAIDIPDPYVNSTAVYLPAASPPTTAPSRTPTTGSYSLNEVYAEASIPLLKDAPLAQALDLSVAARYSDYDTVGSATTGKAGVGWRPIEDVLVRATYSQGFRAPSINELYQGARETSFQGIDPCNGGAAVNAGKPGCAGIPTGYNQANFNLNGLIPGTISGNTQLKPETADTLTYGVAIKPRFAPGLSLTVDRYEIKIQDAIASQSVTQILQLCAARGGVFCDLITRDSGTGAVRNLIQGSQNLNEIETAGIDYTIRYDFSTAIGRFNTMLDWSELETFKTTAPNPTGGAPIVDERVGRGDQPRSTYPKRKGQTSVRWTEGPFTAVYRGRYIGKTTDVANNVKGTLTKEIYYQDIEAGYSFDRFETAITFGVNNIANLSPPRSYANAPINYDIYTYDARGRSYYVRLSAQF